MNNYKDLNELLEAEPKAKGYYDTLPDYVKEAMQERSGGVNSFESMTNYVDKLTRGDN